MSIQAVFWDYDNTILSTAEAHWKKHYTVLAAHGIELSEAHRKRIYENNGNQNWAWMNSELSLKVPESEYLEAIDHEFQQHLIGLEMRPGVAELFELIIELGVPQVIVTNARRNSAKPVLDEKNITHHMKFILFKEDYEGRKPDPAPYSRGIEKLERVLEQPIDPKRCIAIEDDPKGVESAHRAGLVVVHRKLNADDVESPFADYCCYHKEDLIKIMTTLLNK